MARPHTAAPPRFYFSFRSPYSWLAYRDLIERYPDVAGALDWIPFWEPDGLTERLLTEAGGRFVYSPMSREKHLYVLQDVRRLCAERGIAMTWPIDREPRWEVPHLAYIAAVETGRGPKFLDQVYRARWEDGRDICDPAVIADLGAEVGVGADLAHAVDDEEVRARGVEKLFRAYRDDVFGVPFLVIRREKFWGVDRLPAFAAAVRMSAPRPDTAREPALDLLLASAVGLSSDHGHAGGCG